MADQLLLTVQTSLRLPGLGTLAGAGPLDAALRRFPLHANLEVELRLPHGPLRVPATVEELHHSADGAAADAPPAYVLLLDSDAIGELPVGTEIWLPAEWAEIYQLG